MSTIRRIQKSSVAVFIVGFIIILLFFFTLTNILAYVLGFLVSNFNFFINYYSMNKREEIKAFWQVNNFIVRILVYTVLLSLMYKLFGQTEMFIAFLGCLSIRVAIVVQELFSKGG